MKLHGHPLSPRYRRVAIAAAELGVPLELVVLDVRKGEPKQAPYLAKNAMGKMPTFEDDDGWLLWESCAIVTYLADKFPARGLLPVDARGRADALRWMLWTTTHLDSGVAPLYGQKFLAPLRGAQPDPVAVESANKELARYLPVLEAHLADREWMVGDAFSLVDVVVGASIDTLFRSELAFDRATTPRIAAWHARLVERPSWKTGS